MTDFRVLRIVNVDLLSFQIPRSQLEGALSKWTSYQDDVRQFSSWMDSMEANLNESERQHAELRDKISMLGKAKVRAGFQIPFVFLQASLECHSQTKMGLCVCWDCARNQIMFGAYSIISKAFLNWNFICGYFISE